MSLKFKWVLALVLLFAGVAEAATYVLPNGSLPNGCSRSSRVVTCNNLNLSNDDIVNINGSALVTLNINGTANFSNAKVNVNGGPNKLAINVTGNLNSSTGVKIEANIVASTGKVTLGYNGTLIGNITANSATFGGENTMTGSVNVASSVNSTGNNVAISGGIEADSITLGNGSSVGGLINTINLTTGSNVLLSNVNAQTVSLGSSNTVNGYINATSTLTTGSSTQITGNINSPSVTLGSANTLNGSIDATNITIQASNSVVNGDLTASNNIALGSGAAINGNISAGGNITTNSPVTLVGNMSAGGDFTLASGSSVVGNVDAENITMAPSNSLITGDVSAANDVLLGSGNNIIGDVYGTTITLASSNAGIEGNATATALVTINWQGIITGNVTAPHIENNGGTIVGDIFCDTRTGLIRECSTSTGGGSPTTPGGLANCTGFNGMLGDGAGIIGGAEGSPNFSYGSGSTINGLPITGSGGNSPTPSGQVSGVSTNFPPLEPPQFPDNSNFGGPRQTNEQGLPPGSYGTIRTKENGSSSTSGGGVYYINKLELGEKSSITLGTGDYFIKEANLDEKSEIIIAPGATVRIFIRDDFEADEKVEINKNGSAAGLAIYLYSGAEFEMEEKGYFKGLIYSPFSNTEIEFDEKSTIEGGIISAGEVALDEKVTIIFSSQTQQEVAEAAGCAAQTTVIDHYRILHPEEIVSCMAAPITIKACADATCSTLYQGSVITNVLSSNGSSQWDGTTSNAAGIVFSNGQATVGLSLVSGGQTTVALDMATPATTSANKCYDQTGTTSTSCSVNFKTAGLLVSAPSPFAGDDFDVSIRAVETNTETGACEARITGSQTVSLSVECTNPNSCIAGQEFIANNTPLDLNNQTDISLTFTASGEATFSANYTDVGQLKLHASVDLDEAPNLGEPNINDPEVTFTGTGVFVVRPHTLIVQPLNDDGTVWSSTTNSGPGYKAAGETFKVAIQSLNANNDVTPSFGNETTPIQGTVAFTSVAFPNNGFGDINNLDTNSLSFIPHPTLPGTLIGEGAIWNEVGTVNLTPALNSNDYLGAGDVANKLPSPVGRFYPHHFVVKSSSVTNSCSHFTYMAQPKIGIQVELYAVNLSGSLVKNYGHADYAGSAKIDVFTVNNHPSFTDRLAANLNALWINGVRNDLIDNASFARLANNEPDGPFEGVKVHALVTDEQDSRTFFNGTDETLEGELHLKYGRMVLENIYGPEDVQLNVQLNTEYWDGERFVPHSLDNCTPFEHDTNDITVGLSVVADPDLLNPTAADSAGLLVEGAVATGSLYWLPPSGADPRGEFEFEYNAPEWLRFDWGRAGVDGSNENPRATGGFGQYRGNDRVIFSLERNF